VLDRISPENRGVSPGIGLSYCGAEMRRHDPDRFLCALFAPAPAREDLLALGAFNLELARVREQVSEPMLGRIRLQWWREAVGELYAGTPRRHAVAEALGAAVRRRRLDRALIERMIDGREADLDPDPPRDLAALESYAEATAGSLAALSLAALGVEGGAAARAARQVALAWALTGLLRACRFHAARKRQYLPREAMERHGASAEDLFALRPGPALSAAAREVAAAARGHLAAARALKKDVPRAALPVLLPAALAERYLEALERAGFDPLAPGLARRPALAAWHAAAAALLRRY
jgi:phytoene synthase